MLIESGISHLRLCCEKKSLMELNCKTILIFILEKKISCLAKKQESGRKMGMKKFNTFIILRVNGFNPGVAVM